MDKLQTLGISGGAILFYLVNFGILALVLNKYLYRPLVKFLDARQKNIRDNIAANEQLKRDFAQEITVLREQAQKEKAELKIIVERAKAQAAADAKALKTEAELEKNRIIEAAQAEADQIKARLEAEAEKDLLDRISQIVTFALHSSLPVDAVITQLTTAWREVSKK